MPAEFKASLSSLLTRVLTSGVHCISGGRFSVLSFHRVLPNADPLAPTVLDAARFERLMIELQRQFCVVPLIQAIRDAKTGRLPRRAVAITFDDGYADNATVAVPILRRLGLTATFFVTSGFLDGGRMWNDTLIESVRSWEKGLVDLSELGLGVHEVTTVADRIKAIHAIILQTKYLPPSRRNEIVNAVAQRANQALPDDLMMTTSQVRNLIKQGMDVGAHTMTHPILASLSDDEADREIREGKAALEALLGQPVALFAYPNGKPSVDYTSNHVESVRRAGFFGAVSTAMGSATAESDPFQVPRFTPWAQEPARFCMQLAQNFLRTRYPKVQAAGTVRL